MEHLQTVQQIFSDKLFRVPDYQRGYAWEERQWNDLIEDLELMQKDQCHYTGTIVLNNSGRELIDDEARKLAQYDIVDGQQRLTTLAILLHCISIELMEFESRKKQVDGIRKNYIVFSDIYNQEKARLTLNTDCHDYFLKNIISLNPTIQGPVIQSQARLEKALEYFKQYLKEKKNLVQRDYDNWLMDLYIRITNSMEFTVYEVRQTSDVGVIFEVMNNRGKPLSEMDKVKNYLLYLASKLPLDAQNELSNIINTEVGKVFKKLMEAGVSSAKEEDQLLRMSWIIAYNADYREWEGYPSIKQRFPLRKYMGAEENLSLINDVKKYVNVLSEASLAYCDIMAPSHDESYKRLNSDPELRLELVRKAENISRIGNVAPFLPVLMAARIKFPDEYEIIQELLDICEKYAFRVYRLQNSRSNTGQSSLYKLGYDLFNNQLGKRDIVQKIKGLLLYYSPDDKYREKFKLKSIDWYQFYGLKYFLYEYEEHLSAGKGVVMPWERLARADRQETVEHILPQNYSRKYWQERWTQDQAEKYLHDIGNLVLTFDNSKYSNKPFPEKRGDRGLPDCYANANLFQEKELASFSDWTERELLERREKIVAWAVGRWEVEADQIIPNEFADEDNESEEETGSDGEYPPIPTVLSEWSHGSLIGYLERMKSGNRFTYVYFKILVAADKPLEYREVKQKVGELSGREFSGKEAAGMFAGLSRQSTKKRRERLDIESEGTYRINEKYKEIIKKYIADNEDRK